jgi:hypothetical protein
MLVQAIQKPREPFLAKVADEGQPLADASPRPVQQRRPRLQTKAGIGLKMGPLRPASMVEPKICRGNGPSRPRTQPMKKPVRRKEGLLGALAEENPDG